MTDLRDAARQALEALEGGGDSWRLIGPAIAALRAALEQPERAQRMRDAGFTRRPTLREMAEPKQPEQEPEAFMYVGIKHDGTTHGPHLVWKPEHMDAMSAEKGVVASPLYTHPPRREWRGLTYQEIDDLQSGMQITFKDICAIEAALKERNA